MRSASRFRVAAMFAGFAGLAALTMSFAAPLAAIQPKVPATALDLAEFSRPELSWNSSNLPLAELLNEMPNRDAWETFLGDRERSGEPVVAFVDPRSGAATNLVAAFPLLPGSGVGNRITLEALGEALGRNVASVDERAVADVTRQFLIAHAALLGIRPAELGAVRATRIDDRLWHASVPQQVDGIEVRHARLVAAIVHGNVVTVGTEAWGDVELDTTPAIGSEAAQRAAFDRLGASSSLDRILTPPRLEIVPFAPTELQAGESYVGPVGGGYRHRLVWSFLFERASDPGEWEALVDAHSGELLALADTHHAVQRSITGGVYPTTSTGVCPAPGQCGIMQSGWPMPYADTGLPAPNQFANGAGIFDWTSGTATTTLTGRYVDINDTCGIVAASSASGSIDLGGANGQHDCITPGTGGAGNNAAARTAFYDINRVAEQARGWLPANAWLQNSVPVNINTVGTCNAFYSTGNGSLNFYRSGGGCRNTGELAGVFDHEWGHGLDDNDSGGNLSSTSEAYGDLAMIFRLQTSCIGYGFFDNSSSSVCGLTADGTGRNANEALVGPAHCNTDCSGVRDADWAKHANNAPDTALGFVCPSCSAGSGPCGRQVHCSAAPVRQAGWDLVARDLTAAPFLLGPQSAFVVGARLFLQGSGLVGSWYACTCTTTSDGCGATNGYMQWIAADDDNGSLADGTPHMTAIHAAFDRHGIACAAPTPAVSGCASGPTTAPTLSVRSGHFQNRLTWNSVPGATRYWVMRTEGHAGCNLGKTRIADITATTYTDLEVAAGRPYSYSVIAQGTSTACFTQLSACVPSTPGFSIFLDGFESGNTTLWSSVVP